MLLKMEGGGSSQYHTPVTYRRTRPQMSSGYRRIYRACAPAHTYARRRYIQNIPRLVKRNKRGARKLQLYDEPLRDVSFNNQGVSRLLNGINLGNKRSDRRLDGNDSLIAGVLCLSCGFSVRVSVL